MQEHSNDTHKCYACGTHRPTAMTRPFGIAPSGRVLSWVCRHCSDPQQVVGAKPHLKWPTVATAVMLAERGYGDTADQVMGKALALLEREIRTRRMH